MLALSFLAPSRLWLLLLPILLLAAYVVSQLRRRGYVVRFTTMDLLDSVAPKRPRWRRHLPAVGLLLGLVALSLSLAKPAVAQQTADKRGVVVLAMDTSLSMEATDVAPSRLAAAQDAARTFLKNVPKNVEEIEGSCIRSGPSPVRDRLRAGPTVPPCQVYAARLRLYRIGRHHLGRRAAACRRASRLRARFPTRSHRHGWRDGALHLRGCGHADRCGAGRLGAPFH